MQKHKFKDKCDGCHKMKVCRGYADKVLCEDCINQDKNIKPKQIKGELNEQARFVF